MSTETKATGWRALPEVKRVLNGLNALSLEAPPLVVRDLRAIVIEAFEAISHMDEGAVAGEPLTVVYTNWRGETAERRIRPISFWFGSTEWHTKPQWLIKAIDIEKDAERDFAWVGIDFQGDGPALHPAPAGESEVRVRPLNWSDNTARSILGVYRIIDVSGFLSDAKFDVWLESSFSDEAEGAYVTGSFGSWQQAANAAQAHLDFSIRSAIEAAP